jgi:hypothetical protein
MHLEKLEECEKEHEWERVKRPESSTTYAAFNLSFQELSVRRDMLLNTQIRSPSPLPIASSTEDMIQRHVQTTKQLNRH